jgi:hypothetical protein
MENAMSHVEPIVWQWYLAPDTGQIFEVVSVDDTDGRIEVQDYDGNLDEMERANWFALNLEAADSPEEFEGVFDDLELGEECNGGGLDYARLEHSCAMRGTWEDASVESTQR